MKRESYAKQPDTVQVFVIGASTDIILRRNIEQVTVQSTAMGDSGGTVNEIRWECEEAQLRHDAVITADEVQRAFDYWWGKATSAEVNELTQARTAKLEVLSAVCNASIVNGVDIQLSDGKAHHFSLGTEDQLNLLTLSAQAQAGQSIPYHADGEECRMFPPGDFMQITQAAMKHKMWHESYYNSMRVYINVLEDVDMIQRIQYGDAVPEEYQTAVFKTFNV